MHEVYRIWFCNSPIGTFREVFGGFSDENDDPVWLTPDEGVVLAHQVVYWVKDSHQVAWVRPSFRSGPWGGIGARGGLEPWVTIADGWEVRFLEVFRECWWVSELPASILAFPAKYVGELCMLLYVHARRAPMHHGHMYTWLLYSN